MLSGVSESIKTKAPRGDTGLLSLPLLVTDKH